MVWRGQKPDDSTDLFGRPSQVGMKDSQFLFWVGGSGGQFGCTCLSGKRKMGKNTVVSTILRGEVFEAQSEEEKHDAVQWNPLAKLKVWITTQGTDTISFQTLENALSSELIAAKKIEGKGELGPSWSRRKSKLWYRVSEDWSRRALSAALELQKQKNPPLIVSFMVELQDEEIKVRGLVLHLAKGLKMPHKEGFIPVTEDWPGPLHSVQS